MRLQSLDWEIYVWNGNIQLTDSSSAWLLVSLLLSAIRDYKIHCVFKHREFFSVTIIPFTHNVTELLFSFKKKPFVIVLLLYSNESCKKNGNDSLSLDQLFRWLSFVHRRVIHINLSLSQAAAFSQISHDTLGCYRLITTVNHEHVLTQRCGRDFNLNNNLVLIWVAALWSDLGEKSLKTDLDGEQCFNLTK